MVILENQYIQLNYDEVKGFFDIFNKKNDSKVISHAFCSVILKSSDGEKLVLSSFDDNKKEFEIIPVSDDNGEGKL
ncbi:MAG: hypothetical protein ACFFD2_07055, partial [Promethearchaeota archaeon]